MHGLSLIILKLIIIFDLKFIYILCDRKFENVIQYRIKENINVGIVIGRVIDDIKTNSNPIWFMATSEALRFSLNEDNPLFELSSKDGYIRTKQSIDLELLCPLSCLNERGFVNLTVNIWVNEKLQGIAKVSIIIEDVNDNEPYFYPTNISISVKETVYSKGKTIELPKAIDKDIAERNRKIAYKLKEESDYFDLIIRNHNKPYLLLKRTLDNEETNTVETVLLAWNVFHSNARPAQLFVLINILDINDNEPYFPKSLYLVPVKENTPVGSTIYQLNAIDPDKDNHLTYTFISGTPVIITSMFLIHENGTIKLLRSLDYERQSLYQFSVKVTDGEFNAFTKLKMVVIDINDEAPQFTLNPLAIQVYENSEEKDIAQITVFDRDSEDINGYIKCYVPNEVKSSQVATFIPNVYNNLQYTIRLNKQLDRDVDGGDTKILLFTCHDNGIPVPLTTTFTITVTVLDKNDNKPIFSKIMHNIEIKENSPISQPVFQFHALDLDKDQNGKVSYDIIQNSTQKRNFKIDPENGLLYSLINLDRETQEVYQLIIVAFDQSVTEARQTTYLSVNVTVLDENDNIPKLIGPHKFSIYENQGPMTYIGQIETKDEDGGLNGEVKVALVANIGSQYFSILPNGSLFATVSLDREMKEQYSLQVLLIDLGIFVSHTAKVSIYITVLDVNDNAPDIRLPGFIEVMSPDQRNTTNKNSFYPVLRQNVSIYSVVGQVIEKVAIYDPDQHSSHNVTLRHSTTDSPSFLDFNKNTQELFISSELSFQHIGCYLYDLVATDNSPPFLKSEKKFQICVTDILTDLTSRKGITSLSKANILIVIILAGVSAFLTALLVSAILCMIEPCKQLRRRQFATAQNVLDTSNINVTESMTDTLLKSPENIDDTCHMKMMESNVDMNFNIENNYSITPEWAYKLIPTSNGRYATMYKTQVLYAIGTEEQRSDSGRGASDEDNIAPSVVNANKLNQFNQSFLIKPLSSMEPVQYSVPEGMNILSNCGCELMNQSFITSPYGTLQSTGGYSDKLKILCPTSSISRPIITTLPTSILSYTSANSDLIVENELYTDVTMPNDEPNVDRRTSSSNSISDLSSHIDRLFFSKNFLK